MCDDEDALLAAEPVQWKGGGLPLSFPSLDTGPPLTMIMHTDASDSDNIVDVDLRKSLASSSPASPMGKRNTSALLAHVTSQQQDLSKTMPLFPSPVPSRVVSNRFEVVFSILDQPIFNENRASAMLTLLDGVTASQNQTIRSSSSTELVTPMATVAVRDALDVHFCDSISNLLLQHAQESEFVLSTVEERRQRLQHGLDELRGAKAPADDDDFIHIVELMDGIRHVRRLYQRATLRLATLRRHHAAVRIRLAWRALRTNDGPPNLLTACASMLSGTLEFPFRVETLSTGGTDREAAVLRETGACNTVARFRLRRMLQRWQEAVVDAQVRALCGVVVSRRRHQRATRAWWSAWRMPLLAQQILRLRLLLMCQAHRTRRVAHVFFVWRRATARRLHRRRHESPSSLVRFVALDDLSSYGRSVGLQFRREFAPQMDHLARVEAAKRRMVVDAAYAAPVCAVDDDKPSTPPSPSNFAPPRMRASLNVAQAYKTPTTPPLRAQHFQAIRGMPKKRPSEKPRINASLATSLSGLVLR